MHSFEVHPNESACRKKVRLGLEQVLKCLCWIFFRDIRLCWSIFLFACWWMCGVIWWSFLRSLKYNFLLWGRWSCMNLYIGKNSVHIFKKSRHSLMFLWCNYMSVGRGIIGTLLAGFMQHFMPSWSSVLAGTYMWSALNESSGLSGQFQIIISHRYVLNFDGPSQ